MIQNFPVELLHNLQLLALSESLPLVSKRLYKVYQASSPLYRAKFIFFRLSDVHDESELYTKALRYPCCDLEVLDALRSLLRPEESNKKPKTFDLPRRLFKNLANRPTSQPWTDSDAPLPYLRHLFDTFQDEIRPNPNANNGYALTKSVHVQCLPLVRYLLDHGASPTTKDSLAVMVAIRQKNLSLVKTLIERHDRKKKRRLEDQVKADAKMLRVAVQCRAQDITEYLCREKGVVPDMQTLELLYSHSA